MGESCGCLRRTTLVDVRIAECRHGARPRATGRGVRTCHRLTPCGKIALIYAHCVRRAMGRLSWSLLPLVVFAVVLTAFSALPAAAVGLPASTVAAPSVVHAAALPTGTTTTVNSAGLAKTGVTPNPVENRILSSLQASHAPMNEVFLPNFNSRASVSDGVVHPLYSTSPAPMGLGDFGIQNVNGTNVGTISYTQSVKAALDAQCRGPALPRRGGARPVHDPGEHGPDARGRVRELIQHRLLDPERARLLRELAPPRLRGQHLELLEPRLLLPTQRDRGPRAGQLLHR